MEQTKLKKTASTLRDIGEYINTKYFEVENFTHCILLSIISGTNMIALGEPGTAKSAILREIVNLLDFEDLEGTPYFQIQMGSDISPNNVFGSPDIEYYKKHGIIKRQYKGFLPDAIVAFCSEFYRVSDQVANSGLLTILNEGEFKNGTEVLKTKLRFLMADTNFFPKQQDDLDVEESDLKLQALHDRFLARVYVRPLQDTQNKVQMMLMDDTFLSDIRLPMKDVIYLQDRLEEISFSRFMATSVVSIAQKLQTEHNIFISPRRMKLSRNLIKAHAILHGRDYCTVEDLAALEFTFWQKIEDIVKVKDAIFEILQRPDEDAKLYENIMRSIFSELKRNMDNQKDFANYNESLLLKQCANDLGKLLLRIEEEYPNPEEFSQIAQVVENISAEKEEVCRRIPS